METLMETGKNITLDQARQLARRYREAHPTTDNKTPFYFIPKEFLQNILSIPDVDGVKLYLGLSTDPQPRDVLIMVPAAIVAKDTPQEDWVDITNVDLTVTTSQKAQYTRSLNTVVLIKGPCPPPPAGYSRGKVD